MTLYLISKLRFLSLEKYENKKQETCLNDYVIKCTAYKAHHVWAILDLNSL